jgi:hypothetical protein
MTMHRPLREDRERPVRAALGRSRQSTFVENRTGGSPCASFGGEPINESILNQSEARTSPKRSGPARKSVGAFVGINIFV